MIDKGSRTPAEPSLSQNLRESLEFVRSIGTNPTQDPTKKSTEGKTVGDLEDLHSWFMDAGTPSPGSASSAEPHYSTNSKVRETTRTVPFNLLELFNLSNQSGTETPVTPRSNTLGCEQKQDFLWDSFFSPVGAEQAKERTVTGENKEKEEIEGTYVASQLSEEKERKRKMEKTLYTSRDVNEYLKASAERERELSKFKETQKYLQSENELLKRELQNKQDRIKILEEELHNVKHQKEALEEKEMKSQQREQELVHRFKEIYGQLRDEIQQLQDKCGSFQKSYSEIQRELSQTKEELNILKEQSTLQMTTNWTSNAHHSRESREKERTTQTDLDDIFKFILERNTEQVNKGSQNTPTFEIPLLEPSRAVQTMDSKPNLQRVTTSAFPEKEKEATEIISAENEFIQFKVECGTVNWTESKPITSYVRPDLIVYPATFNKDSAQTFESLIKLLCHIYDTTIDKELSTSAVRELLMKHIDSNCVKLFMNQTTTEALTFLFGFMATPQGHLDYLNQVHKMRQNTDTPALIYAQDVYLKTRFLKKFDDQKTLELFLSSCNSYWKLQALSMKPPQLGVPLIAQDFLKVVVRTDDFNHTQPPLLSALSTPSKAITVVRKHQEKHPVQNGCTICGRGHKTSDCTGKTPVCFNCGTPVNNGGRPHKYRHCRIPKQFRGFLSKQEIERGVTQINSIDRDQGDKGLYIVELPTPHLHGTTHLNGIIDGGATGVFFPAELVRRCGLKVDTSKQAQVKLADGSIIISEGTVTFTAFFGHLARDVQAVVIPGKRLFIGELWLRKNIGDFDSIRNSTKFTWGPIEWYREKEEEVYRSRNYPSEYIAKMLRVDGKEEDKDLEPLMEQLYSLSVERLNPFVQEIPHQQFAITGRVEGTHETGTKIQEGNQSCDEQSENCNDEIKMTQSNTESIGTQTKPPPYVYNYIPITAESCAYVNDDEPKVEEVINLDTSNDKKFPQSSNLPPKIQDKINGAPNEWTTTEQDLIARLNMKIGDNYSTEKIPDYEEVRKKTEYTIILTAPGFKENPRCIPRWKEDEIRAQIEVLLQKKMIFEVEPKKAICISNIVPIRKADGTWRLAIDYRRLNRITEDMPIRVPQVEIIFQNLDNLASFFGAIDISNAYYHYPIKEEDKLKTCFWFGGKCYAFNVVAFGLKNAPTFFNENVLLELGLPDGFLQYFDDITFEARSWEELFRKLELLLDKLKNNHFKVNFNKIQLGRKIKLLGLIREEGRLVPNPEKIEALKMNHLVKDSNDLRRVLGVLRYFQNMTPNLATRLAPYHDKLKTGQFSWSERDQKSLQELIDELTEKMIRYVPDWSKPFYIYTDASDVGVGGYLFQKGVNEEVLPIFFFSKGLSPVMSRWSVYEREAYGLIYAISKCKPYLGKRFTVYTDHKPLLALIKSVKEDTASHKVFRWLMAIAQYPCDIIHVQGKDNVIADALSRTPFVPPVEEQMPETLNAIDTAEIEELPQVEEDHLFNDDAFEIIA